MARFWGLFDSDSDSIGVSQQFQQETTVFVTANTNFGGDEVGGKPVFRKNKIFFLEGFDRQVRYHSKGHKMPTSKNLE